MPQLSALGSVAGQVVALGTIVLSRIYFVSAEVGSIDNSTVAVTFSGPVSAIGDDYASGVTIKVNDSAVAVSSATRQSNHALVYYVLGAVVHSGDTVTWEYAI